MSALNASLAAAAVAIWTGSYGLFFARDLRRWWRGRHRRRQLEAAAREQAVRAYAAWVRNIPPPRSRVPIMPMAMPTAAAAPARAPANTAVVLPFPQGRRAARR